MKYLFPFILSVGCTDYELKNVDDVPTGGSEAETPTESTGEGQAQDTAEEAETPGEPNNETDDDCIETYVTFDIEEVSTLQDAVSYSVANWSQDAVVLNFDTSTLQPDQTWRVSSHSLFPHGGNCRC